MSSELHTEDIIMSDDEGRLRARGIAADMSLDDVVQGDLSTSGGSRAVASSQPESQIYQQMMTSGPKLEQVGDAYVSNHMPYSGVQSATENVKADEAESNDVVEMEVHSKTELSNEEPRNDLTDKNLNKSISDNYAPVGGNKLVILYDKPRYTHIKTLLIELEKVGSELTVINLNTIEDLKSPNVRSKDFKTIHICVEYNNEFESNMEKLNLFLEEKPAVFQKAGEVAYHFQFDPKKSWQSDYTEKEKTAYTEFLNALNSVAGDKVVQCSIINKYETKTVYLTVKEELEMLGKEIQADITHWANLKIFDYRENCIRFLPGIKFPLGLETLNLGGSYSLETLSGFKMPPKLKSLIASEGSITSIDNVNFPTSLERLDLSDNKIYFLNYAELPQGLRYLDLTSNRIDNVRGVDFPRTLKALSIAQNPIECIKGVRFPEGISFLDVSCIPNESMTGVKFPDSLFSLNLQESMTNTRGLKLPSFLKEVNLGGNGVNSINPLKLPNSIEVLYLNNNNIKTLNKVQFPSALKELYLGNNLITTLKNVQFPSTLEVLDMEMDPITDENDKHITTLKDVILPSKLRVLKLGYHAIKSIESIEFPFSLRFLSISYNELKVIRNVRFGPNLYELDLSGNQFLTNIDGLVIPNSTRELRIPPQLISNLPVSVVEMANKHELVITKSLPY